MVNAIQYMPGTGCECRAIPDCSPPFTTVWNYFYAWGRDGTIKRMKDRFRARGCALAGHSESPTAAVTDTQSAETTESGGPSGCDAGKKAKGRKRHLAVDVEGFLIETAIQKASVQDRDGAPAAVLDMLEAVPLVGNLWADGGYRGPEPTAARKNLGLGYVLELVEKPKDVKRLSAVYRRRAVERTFAWISRCLHLTKDCERSLDNSLAWAQLAACRFMMRRIARNSTS